MGLIHFRLASFCGLAAVAVFATTAQSEPLKPGIAYEGPRTLDVDVLRTSFKLSRGLTGTQRGEAFVMGHKSLPGLILATSRLRISAKQLMTELRGPIPIDSGVSLALDGNIKRKGDRLVARYRGPGVFGAVVSRRHAPSGRSVAFIAVAQSPKALAPMRKLAEKMASSVRFRALPKANAKWKRRLSNKVFRTFNTTDSTSSNKTLTFCADGRYTFRSSSSGSSVIYGGAGAISSGVSYAGQGGSGGTWTVVGKGARATLQLTDTEAGEVLTFELARNKSGHWLFEGKRWLHDANASAQCP